MLIKTCSQEKHVSFFAKSFSFPIVIFAIAGGFVYGGLDGALAMVILSILLAGAGTLSFIPFAGPILQWFVSLEIIFPGFQNLTGIEPTILTFIIFGYEMFLGIIFCATTTFYIIRKIKNWFEKKAFQKLLGV